MVLAKANPDATDPLPRRLVSPTNHMKLQAKQETAINTPKGLRYVKGPQVSDHDELLDVGEAVEVPDDFVVNPQVWDVITPPAGGKPVDLVEFDDDGMPKARPKKKNQAQAPGAVTR